MIDTSDMDVEDEIEGLKPHISTIRRDLKVAEALARASLMTPASAGARLMAKRLHLTTPEEFMPPRMVLLYLVRMGSFQSTPKIMNADSQDDDFYVSGEIDREELLAMCKFEKPPEAILIGRDFSVKPNKSYLGQEVLRHTDTIRQNNDPNCIRVLQWNILSQTLGQQLDSFIRCPAEALSWNTRKYSILEEILRCKPDVICLQEVDHFSFLKKTLGTQGYEGVFFEKPDSPCLYVEGNNGPDGCAIFYKDEKYTCVEAKTKILEVWKVKSNQVAIVMILKSKHTDKEVCIATTHLKAKKGALLARLRDEQARDLLNFVSSVSNGRPVIICGDFNGEPSEPFYKTMQYFQDLELASTYAEFNQTYGCDQKDDVTHENTYTTWKIRENGEECHTIDYIFFSPSHLSIDGVYRMPTPNEIGDGRLPSFNYPSDHLSLAADFSFL